MIHGILQHYINFLIVSAASQMYRKFRQKLFCKFIGFRLCKCILSCHSVSRSQININQSNRHIQNTVCAIWSDNLMFMSNLLLPHVKLIEHFCSNVWHTLQPFNMEKENGKNASNNFFFSLSLFIHLSQFLGVFVIACWKSSSVEWMNRFCKNMQRQPPLADMTLKICHNVCMTNPSKPIKLILPIAGGCGW